MTFKILTPMRRRERPAPPLRPRSDHFPEFTPREWADLPIYHPRAD